MKIYESLAANFTLLNGVIIELYLTQKDFCSFLISLSVQHKKFTNSNERSSSREFHKTTVSHAANDSDLYRAATGCEDA